jgi:hypothetical protein
MIHFQLSGEDAPDRDKRRADVFHGARSGWQL